MVDLRSNVDESGFGVETVLSIQRDPGLQEAIRAVGGVTELARRLGISQPSVSNWDKIPPDRVSLIESVTGVSRAILRPDLFGDDTRRDLNETDAARAQEYALLATLLRRAPDEKLLAGLSRLRGNPTPLGMAHIKLAEAAAEATTDSVNREYFDLFIGLGRGELLPYASYYLTGFLQERPLARLRHDLAHIGVERVPGEIEPEDHAAFLFEIMSGLVRGEFSAAECTDRAMFKKHLSPWIGRFRARFETR